MESAMKTKLRSHIVVEYHDLQDAIEENYNLSSSFCAIGESPNDSQYTFNGIKQREPDKWDTAAVKKALENSYIEIWALRPLLVDMCNKGFIEPGDYLVNVSW
jgi:hypothetical protein